LAAALWGLSQASSMAEGSQPGLEVQSLQSSQPTSRKNAVLVFGASGRLGKQVVAEVMMMSLCHANISTFAASFTSIIKATCKKCYAHDRFCSTCRRHQYFVHCSLLGQEDMWLPRLTKQTSSSRHLQAKQPRDLVTCILRTVLTSQTAQL